jgi:hypothetical protein
MKRSFRRCPSLLAASLAILSLILAGGAFPAAAQPARRPLASNRITAVVSFTDGALYGTARGLFARPDSGLDGAIAGFDGFVTGIAEQGGMTLVGSTSGPSLLSRGAIQPLRTPGGWTEPFVTAVAAADSRLFFAGPFGLAEAITGGGIRELTTPGDLRSVEALAGRGPDLLVAFDGGLYHLHARREEWKALVSGISYTALAIGSHGKWLGVRADGGLDEGMLDRPGTRRAVEGPYADDAVTAVAVSDDGFVLLIGTMRGRILLGDPGDENNPVADWRSIRTPSPTDPSIRALACRDGKLIRAGADGGGILEINLAGGTPITKEIVSSAEPVLRVERSPETASGSRDDNSLGSPWEFPELRARWDAWIPTMDFRVAWLGYAALTILVLALAAGAAWVASRLRSSGGSSGLREKRRANRTPTDLPTLDQLSPDVAEFAHRFQDVTQLINELSRDAARGVMTPAAAGQARQASKDFEEIDTWMRDRLTVIRAERVATQKRLHDLKAEVRDAGSDEAAIGAEVARIEEWLSGADRDERYLKYVLEE